MSVTGTLTVVRHLQRRVVYLTQDRDNYMRKARDSTGQDRTLWTRLARILSFEIVRSKRRVNVLQGRRPSDDGIPQRPSDPQLELRQEG